MEWHEIFLICLRDKNWKDIAIRIIDGVNFLVDAEAFGQGKL